MVSRKIIRASPLAKLIPPICGSGVDLKSVDNLESDERAQNLRLCRLRWRCNPVKSRAGAGYLTNPLSNDKHHWRCVNRWCAEVGGGIGVGAYHR